MQMPARVLVAGIGDPGRDGMVLDVAVRLARQSEARLWLVHACAVPLLGGGPGVEVDPLQITAVLDAHRESFTSAVRDRYPEDALECVVELGPPHEVVAHHARALAADLVLVGAHARHGLMAGFLGTVAQRVLRASPAPVLVVRDGMLRPTRILLTTDLSPQSAAVHERGLDLVEEFLRPGQAELRSLMVLGAAVVPSLVPTPVMDRAVHNAFADFLADRERRWAVPAPRLRTGFPADEIAAEALEWPADLVILGTHGRHGLPRMVLGSVAEAAVRELGCNVLVVPPVPAGAQVPLESALLHSTP